jgi:hypothetical protein
VGGHEVGGDAGSLLVAKTRGEMAFVDVIRQSTGASRSPMLSSNSQPSVAPAQALTKLFDTTKIDHDRQTNATDICLYTGQYFESDGKVYAERAIILFSSEIGHTRRSYRVV